MKGIKDIKVNPEWKEKGLAVAFNCETGSVLGTYKDMSTAYGAHPENTTRVHKFNRKKTTNTPDLPVEKRKEGNILTRLFK